MLTWSANKYDVVLCCLNIVYNCITVSGVITIQNRRILTEIRKLQEWEPEKKFVLESWSTFGTLRGCIRGRIFPEKDPYCFASLRIEIKLPVEYPFKLPQSRILDPIYHPNIMTDGEHCCCWGFNPDSWRPTTSLIDIIKAILRIVNSYDSNHYNNLKAFNEYQNHYEQFYEKALRCALHYGRRRY